MGPREWVEKHVMGDGDLLCYGNLFDELEEAGAGVFWEELKRAAAPYVAGGRDRARAAQARVDDLIRTLLARDARFGYAPPFCHKGCANCCHQLVYCTLEEARAIHAHCLERAIAIDYGKLQRQLRHVDVDAAGDHTGTTTWDDQPDADRRCAFLGPDRACAIWPVRPLVCRAQLAEGTDAHCTPHNGEPDPEAAGITYVEVNYLISAVFTIHRDSVKKTMGRLLLDLR
ncbi:YkgJ family cysteine cluster protein [Mesoterricola silvestris]|uniref:YkgJ family cysteine cluster protein n=1 Tax=Mesoterricola silvestris TaxID=2927979 RepID=A0AA48K8V0_9BACT|nr:YkgJ family cysteine cluster protein [Mesoterricola silvestris]BDU72726.1 hypothetical protein METEAL_19000 [Mesoterricola silvestris]